MAPTPDAALGLLKQVPGLRITLDWTQMLCREIPQADTLLLTHTRHVQVRQAAPGHLQTPYAEGRFDEGAALTMLDRAG